MEKEELRLELSFEVKETLRTIGALDQSFQNLAKSAQTDLREVNSVIKELVDIRGIANTRQELAQVNRAIKELRANERGLKEVGLRDDFEEKTRRARIAVYGLNQVVRDLPFGFIAISNNIPVLLDQLQALVRETGSVKGGLKAFAAGFLGAGGVSIAISAAISLITAAVQKFGSLNAALKAVFGTLTTGEKIAASLKKSIPESIPDATKQIADIAILNKLSKDTTIGIEQQTSAQKKLLKVVDDIIKSRNLEKEGLKQVDQATTDYAVKVLKAGIILGAYRQVIGELAKDYAELAIEGRGFGDTLAASLEKANAAISLIKAGKLKQAIDVLKLPVVGEDGLAQKRFEERLKKRQQAISEATKKYLEQIEVFIKKEGIKVEDLFGGGEEDKAGKKGKEFAAVYLQRLAALKDLYEQQARLEEEGSADQIRLLRKATALEAQIRRAGLVEQYNDRVALNNAILADEARLVADLEKIGLPLEKIAEKSNEVKKALGSIDPAPLGSLFNPKQIDITPILEKFKQQIESFTNTELAALNERIAATLSNLAARFTNTLVNGLLEGGNALDVIKQSLRGLVAQLAAAAAKALVFKAAMAALSALGTGGGGGFFSSLLGGLQSVLGGGGFGAGGFARGLGGGSVAPAVLGAEMPGQAALTTRVRGSDLEIVLNRTLRAGGRLG